MSFWKWNRKWIVPLAPIAGTTTISASIPWEIALEPIQGESAISISQLINGWIVLDSSFESQTEILADLRIDHRIINPILSGQTTILASVVYGGVDIWNPIFVQSTALSLEALQIITDHIALGGSFELQSVMSLNGQLDLWQALGGPIFGALDLASSITDALSGNIRIVQELAERETVKGSWKIWSDLTEESSPVSPGFYFDRNHVG